MKINDRKLLKMRCGIWHGRGHKLFSFKCVLAVIEACRVDWHFSSGSNHRHWIILSLLIEAFHRISLHTSWLKHLNMRLHMNLLRRWMIRRIAMLSQTKKTNCADLLNFWKIQIIFAYLSNVHSSNRTKRAVILKVIRSINTSGSPYALLCNNFIVYDDLG